MKKTLLLTLALLFSAATLAYGAESRFQLTWPYLTDTEAGIVYRYGKKCDCFLPLSFETEEERIYYSGVKATAAWKQAEILPNRPKKKKGK